MDTRRVVEIQTLNGWCMELNTDSTSTVHELKKQIQERLQKEDKDIPRIKMQLACDTTFLDSGIETLADLETRLGKADVFSLIKLEDPIWAKADDFKAFREADMDEEIVRMIQDRGRAWLLESSRKPFDLHTISPTELEKHVKEMGEEVLHAHCETLGLNDDFAAIAAAAVEPAGGDHLAPYFRMLRMHHAHFLGYDGMERLARDFLPYLMRIDHHMSTEELKQQVPHIMTWALKFGQDEKFMKNMLIALYHGLESTRRTRMTYDMIDWLVLRKYWKALEEQVRLQPEILTHAMRQTKYVNCFPKLYSIVLPEADWSFVQLLLDAGLYVDPELLLPNMKPDNNGFASSRLRSFLDLSPAAINRCMAWAAEQTSPDYLKLMLDATVDPSLDLSGLLENACPLSLAISNQRPDNIELLASVGAQVTPELCNLMEAKIAELEIRVEWMSLRQDRVQKDFAYCYDERKRRLQNERLVCNRFKDLLPTLLSVSGKRRKAELLWL